MKKTTTTSRAATLIAGLSLSLSANASIAAITCSSSDYTCQAATNVCNNTSSGTDAIGFAGGTSAWTAILMFPLPTMPAGMIVGDQTTLTITENGTGNSTTMHGDLWGVANFRTDIPAFGTVPNSTYYYYLNNDTGPGANATPSDVKILDNFLTTNLIGKPANFAVTTVFGATNTLQQYIQGFYTANPTYNASSGQAYVWLRIDPDGPSTSTVNRYIINAGDASSALKPVLNLELRAPPVTLPLT